MPATSQPIPEPLLHQVSLRVEACTGLHFPPARFADLERGLNQAARERGHREVRTYIDALLGADGLAPAERDALVGSLAVGETHFMRDPQAFAFLETRLLPELLEAKRASDRQLRIWSAGCASGEEPYSIAILLHRLLPGLGDWQISILGTDINPKALDRAAAGIYTEWSFRDAPAWMKPGYFSRRAAGRWEVQPWLRRMVEFAPLNLADEVWLARRNPADAFDLVVCRNVLLYFAPARIPAVVARLQRVLVEGGLLMLGAVEAGHLVFPGLASIPAPAMALYRKERAGPAPVQGPWEAVVSDPRSVVSDWSSANAE